MHMSVMATPRLRPPPSAQKMPMQKSRESPGRKGVTTRPVSMKMMRKSGEYTHTGPSWTIHWAMKVRGSCSSAMMKWTNSMGSSRTGA